MEALLPFLIALAVFCFIMALSTDSDGDSAAATARSKAERICHGQAQTYDVQNQNTLVYACADGKLRVMPYGR